MYESQRVTAQIGEGNTGQFNIACLNRVERMCNRREEGEIEKYFIAFKYALFFVIASIPKDKKNLILQDFAILAREIEEINHSSQNEQSKKETILNLKLEFAEVHEYHIFEAFSRIGILHISDEGVLDFNKHDIENLRSIAKGESGTPAAARAATEREQRKQNGMESELPK